MRYSVAWNPSVAERIDAVWTAADQVARRQLSDCVSSIEQQLRQSPLQVGESRRNDMERVLILHPVTVHYLVDPRLRFVRVYFVQFYADRQ